MVCSFLVMSLSGFGVKIMLASHNELEIVPYSSIFQKSFCKFGFISSLDVGQYSPVNPSRPGVSFTGRFLTTNTIVLLGYTYSVIFHDSLCLLGNLSISFKLLNLLAHSFSQHPLVILFVSTDSVVYPPPFSFFILMLCIFVFSLIKLRFLKFIFSKNQHWAFYFIYFSSRPYCFSLLLNLFFVFLKEEAQMTQEIFLLF